MRSIIIIAVFLTLIFSCKKSNTPAPPAPTPDPYEGTWHFQTNVESRIYHIGNHFSVEDSPMKWKIQKQYTDPYNVVYPWYSIRNAADTNQMLTCSFGPQPARDTSVYLDPFYPSIIYKPQYFTFIPIPGTDRVRIVSYYGLSLHFTYMKSSTTGAIYNLKRELIFDDYGIRYPNCDCDGRYPVLAGDSGMCVYGFKMIRQ